MTSKLREAAKKEESGFKDATNSPFLSLTQNYFMKYNVANLNDVNKFTFEMFKEAI